MLVDTKEVEDGSTYAVHAKTSQHINDLPKWRTFIFASGAFPSDLMKYKIDEENLIPRLDWKYWLAQIGGNHKTRKPTFSDYTIQHPIYKESSQFFPPTTSIRYTLKDEWFLFDPLSPLHRRCTA